MLSMVLIFLIGVIYFSRFYLGNAELLFDKAYYYNEYYMESLNLAKMMIVLFNFVLVTNSFVFNKYDYFLITRKSRKEVIISKVFILLILSILYTFIIMFMFFLIPLFLTPYMRIFDFFDITKLMMVFSVYYLTLFIFFIIIFKHIYILFFSFSGYLISFLSSELLIKKSETSFFNSFISVFFPDIINYYVYGYDFLYGSIFVMSLTIILLLVIIKNYTTFDI